MSTTLNITPKSEVFEAYKSDLNALSEALKLVDGLDWSIYYEYGLNVLIDRYSEDLGFNKRTIENHLLQLTQPLTHEVKTKYTLKEIIEEYSIQSSWLVPRMFKVGALYVVGAAPKSYKSMFMYDLAYSVSVSGTFLGYPCKKGRVIYFQCEEGLPTVADRLVSRGFDDDTDSRVYDAMSTDQLIIHRKFNIKSDLHLLESMIQELDPSLIIFDSLRKISAQIECSENSADYSKYIYNLQNLILMYNKTAIIIHHKNKSTAKGLNSLSGSLSIAGATDGVILMTPEPTDGRNLIKVETIPRDGSPLSMTVEFVRKEGGEWTFDLHEETDIDPEVVLLEKKLVRELVKLSPRALTRYEIASHISISRSDPKLTVALDRLVEGYVISRKKDKLTKIYTYYIPTDSPWLESEKFTTSYLSKEAIEADKLVSCRTKQDLKSLTDGWTSDYKTSVFSLLKPSEQERILRLVQTPEYSNGSAIMYDGRKFKIEYSKWDTDHKTVVYKLNDLEGFIREPLLQKAEELEIYDF